MDIRAHRINLALSLFIFTSLGSQIPHSTLHSAQKPMGRGEADSGSCLSNGHVRRRQIRKGGCQPYGHHADTDGQTLIRGPGSLLEPQYADTSEPVPEISP